MFPLGLRSYYWLITPSEPHVLSKPMPSDFTYGPKGRVGGRRADCKPYRLESACGVFASISVKFCEPCEAPMFRAFPQEGSILSSFTARQAEEPGTKLSLTLKGIPGAPWFRGVWRAKSQQWPNRHEKIRNGSAARGSSGPRMKRPHVGILAAKPLLIERAIWVRKLQSQTLRR